MKTVSHVSGKIDCDGVKRERGEVSPQLETSQRTQTELFSQKGPQIVWISRVLYYILENIISGFLLISKWLLK